MLSLAQKQIANSPARFRTAICGRRFGKSYLAMRELAKFASKPNQRIFYVAPSYRMAKQIIWDKLKYKLMDMNWVEKVNESDLTIHLINGSKISLRGADNFDSLRGVGLDFLVMDEFAMIDEKAWTEVLRATLSDTGGHALFISTPMGMGNWAYELYQNQHKDPEHWASFSFTSLDGGRIPAEEIEQARRDLDERTFRQEYMATFEEAGGRIYYAFDRNHNVRECEVADRSMIFVGMDFNIDPMSAVISVRYGDTLHIIDEIKIFSSNTQEMVDEIKQRYPKSKVMCFPDPAGHQRKSSAGGMTDITILQNAGFVVKAPRHHTPVRDRINAVNSRLCDATGIKHLYVAPTVKYTIEGLERHTYKDGSTQPDKDSGYDHMMDALGYMVDYLFPVKRDTSHIEQPKTWGMKTGNYL
jgi:phage terminase large subunit